MAKLERRSLEKDQIIFAKDEDPKRFGAKHCPNCGPNSELKLITKSIAAGTYFSELKCMKCNREAISDVQIRLAKSIVESVSRWNSIWPDVSGYIEGDTEGFKIWTTT